MTHRIISCTMPSRIMSHVREAGCISRLEETNYRGPIADEGDGRVWGVADLINVKPAHRGKAKDGIEAPQGYLWCFEELREVEAIPCAVIPAPAMFDNGGKWEPLFLQASAQTLLDRALSPQDGQEEPETPSGVSGPTEPPLVGIPSISRGKMGQLEMF